MATPGAARPTVASPIGFHVTCELISVACLSGTIFPIFLVLWFGVLTRILERGRSVFDRFSLSVPCLVRPGLLQNVVRAARHSRSVSGGRGRMLASGDQVVGALQVGVLQATSAEA